MRANRPLPPAVSRVTLGIQQINNADPSPKVRTRANTGPGGPVGRWWPSQREARQGAWRPPTGRGRPRLSSAQSQVMASMAQRAHSSLLAPRRATSTSSPHALHTLRSFTESLPPGPESGFHPASRSKAGNGPSSQAGGAGPRCGWSGFLMFDQECLCSFRVPHLPECFNVLHVFYFHKMN